MWLETDANTRINHRRLEEVISSEEIETIITACPYCMIMFDDAIRSKGLSEKITVQDISEILSDNSEEATS
jgi:Fe-S oxidoreductase